MVLPNSTSLLPTANGIPAVQHDRKYTNRRTCLPFLFILLFAAYLFYVLDVSASSSLSAFFPKSFTPSESPPDQTDQPQHQIPQLRSPIFQPLRTVKQHQPTDEDKPLIAELQRIKHVHDWRLLDFDSSTADRIYFDAKTNQTLTNEANIAFFLQLSQSNLKMAPRLLSRLWHPENIYCIHFDSKIPYRQADLFTNAVKSNPKLSNVFFLPSVPVTYTGLSMILNTLESINALLTISDKWHYFINLSGSDYPLLSATAMRRLLGQPRVLNSAINFVHYGGNPTVWAEQMKHRFGLLHFDLSLGFNPKSDEKIYEEKRAPNRIYDTDNLKLQVPKGEAWVMAHRSFCEYAAHGDAARRVIALFSNMQSTPEHFFQTLAWNDDTLNKTTVRTSFRLTVWGLEGQVGGHPAYLDRQTSSGEYDLWDNMAFSACFIARKFHVPNSNLLEHIDHQKSGATDGVANITAVSNSFYLAQQQLSCQLDKHTSSGNGPRSCWGVGWRKQSCNAEKGPRCVGRFAEPVA